MAESRRRKHYRNLPPAIGPAALPPYLTHQRLVLQPDTRSPRYAIETFITLLIWAGLIYATVLYIGGHPEKEHGGWLGMLAHLLRSMGIIALVYSALLLLDLFIMALWASLIRLLGARSKKNAQELEERRLMRAFEVSRTMFDRLQQSNVVTIFHDELGDIESIRAGHHVLGEEDGLSQLPPESFLPTAWNSLLPEDELHSTYHLPGQELPIGMR